MPAVEIQSRIAVIRIDFINRKPSLVAEVLQHHFLRFNADAFACLFVILAESAIDCCAINGLLIPHLKAKMQVSFLKVHKMFAYGKWNLQCTSKHRLWSPKRRLVGTVPSPYVRKVFYNLPDSFALKI